MNTQFIKVENGIRTIKARKNIVITEPDLQIFNPSDEMLFERGWEIYDPTPTQEELFENSKQQKINDIKFYDTSTDVNSFYIGEYVLWLDKATRAGLKLRFDAEIASGKTDTTLWYGNFQFNLPLDKASQMLYALELYASACYDNTQLHLANVSQLTTLEDIENYDYTTGYPEKLHFDEFMA